MRVVVQRVLECSVKIDTVIHSSIGPGFLILLGVEESDNTDDLNYLVSKICNMRVFSDEAGKMNLDLKEMNGELLVVSQFTLHASTKKGNRPSFIKAGRPEIAKPLYELFITACERLIGKPVKAGVFGADMKVSLVNDGPVTILLDSKNKE
jgi:D-tyrosyl-tRNA(Tyr) deacylase